MNTLFLTNNKYIAQAIYTIATICAVVVATSKFAYAAWVDNDMTAKIKTFIIELLNVFDSGSTFIRNELSESD